MDCKNEEESIPVRVGEKFHETLINEHEIRNTYENQDNDYVIYENQLTKDHSEKIPNAKRTTLTGMQYELFNIATITQILLLYFYRLCDMFNFINSYNLY